MFIVGHSDTVSELQVDNIFKRLIALKENTLQFPEKKQHEKEQCYLIIVLIFRLHLLASGYKSDLISFFLGFTTALQVNTEYVRLSKEGKQLDCIFSINISINSIYLNVCGSIYLYLFPLSLSLSFSVSISPFHCLCLSLPLSSSLY